MVNIAIFSSNNGSNIDKIYKYIKDRKLDDENREDSINIKMVFINNRNSFSIKRCKELNIPYLLFNNDYMYSGKLLNKLIFEKIDFIVLCEFLNKIPIDIINSYKNKIINIHPSLLPKYSGEGMYGINIHKLIIKNKENYSGISIHYVNSEYNKGELIFRSRIKVFSTDTPESLSNKIHQLEYKWYPVIIYSICNKKI
jgi:phosphoribosylglycinamide formyltransferase-1